MPLHLDIRVGESVVVTPPKAEPITITLKEKSGNRARLSIDADKSVVIDHQRRSPVSIAAAGIHPPAAIQSTRGTAGKFSP